MSGNVNRPSYDERLYQTVLIEASGPNGAGVGTGFMFHYYASEENGGGDGIFLVTNKHVIEGATNGKFFFTRRDPVTGDPLVGQRYDVTIEGNFEQMWHGHPDPDVDIAIMPMNAILKEIEDRGDAIFWVNVSSKHLPTEDNWRRMTAGWEVMFVGYPSGWFDSSNLTPIIRNGTAATPPAVDYEGKPVFLIDASVFPGSSGSPVFSRGAGPIVFEERDGEVYMGNIPLFLGVIAMVGIMEDEGRIEFISVPTDQQPVAVIQQMLDLGFVFKSRTVVEAIEDFARPIFDQKRAERAAGSTQPQ